MNYISYSLQNFQQTFTNLLAKQTTLGSDDSNKNEDESLPKTYVATGRFASGDFSEVYLTHLRSNALEKLVLKSFKKSEEKWENCEMFDDMTKEKEILQLLQDSEFFPKLHDCFENRLSYNIVIGYAAGGDFFRYFIEDDNFLDPESLKLCISELLHAISYLHLRDILHLDIKLGNTLISQTGHVVITDFDISVLAKDLDSIIGVLGTPSYIAPEILLKGNYSFAADHWSLGIMIYCMLTHSDPYKETSSKSYDEVLSEMTLERELEIPNQTEDLKNLLGGLLQKDPKLRIGLSPSEFDKVQKHPYFEGIDWNLISSRTSTPPFREVPIIDFEEITESITFEVEKSHL